MCSNVEGTVKSCQINTIQKNIYSSKVQILLLKFVLVCTSAKINMTQRQISCFHVSLTAGPAPGISISLS